MAVEEWEKLILASPVIKNKYFNLGFWVGNRMSSLDVALNYAVGGVFCEFGVFKGESASFILKSDKCRVLSLFDSFQGLPEDFTPKMTKGYFQCDVPKFNDERVEMFQGYFEEFKTVIQAREWDLIHFDADLYSSTKLVMDNIKIKIGQIWVFDEIIRMPGGIHREHELKALVEVVSQRDVQLKIIGHTEYSQAVFQVMAKE